MGVVPVISISPMILPVTVKSPPTVAAPENVAAPDAFIVEKKSSGVALYQEMRRMGLIIQEYTPHRGSETPLNEGGGEKPKFLNKRG